MTPPIDIIYSAIDSVGDDVPTLKSLSLTSKLLTEYSQRRLLRAPQLTVELSEGAGLWYIGWLLKKKPHLSTAVKSFTLTFTWCKNNDVLQTTPPKYIGAIRAYMDRYAGPFIAKLTNLKSLSLKSFDYYEIIRHSNVATMNWVHHLSSPNLTSISMAHLPFTIPTSLYSRAPQLRTIISDCAPIRIADEDNPLVSRMAAGGSESLPSTVCLRAFQLTSAFRGTHLYAGEPDPNELFKHPEENAPSFKELQRFTFGSPSHGQHSTAAHIMAAASNTLSHFTFHIPDHSSSSGLTSLEGNLLRHDNCALFQSLKALETVKIRVGGHDLMIDARQRVSSTPRMALISWIVDVAFPTLCAAPNLRQLEIVITNLDVPGLFVAIYEQDWGNFNEKLMLKECATLRDVLFVLHLRDYEARATQNAVNDAVQTFFAGALEAGIHINVECHFS
ncbi:hypothetical protein BKA70DRAFT_1268042 [Coprinopsis sp. MPI-PUGE-AT-0042]|nr:hypothetical protein BKA70DRAFT_1268042 [Coprinopsis sp. MPI-PUGE-AT-0042]